MDLKTCELRKNGLRVKLQEQPFRILSILVLEAGQLVPRDELCASLSGHREYDSKQALHNAIQKIREALNDSAESPRYIETLGGRGYRFLASVEVISNGSAPDKLGPTGDTFVLEISEASQQLFLATSESQLMALYYRVAGLTEQYPCHPSSHEAHLLQDSIRAALRPFQKISPAVLARVFDDPNSISVPTGGNGHWQTIGSTGQSVIVMVDHTMNRENDREIVRIISGRKATPDERTFYERNNKKS